MKKEIKIEKIVILVMGVVIITLLATLGIFTNKIRNYEDKYERLSYDYNKLVDENVKLADEVKDLNDNIYNLFEKQPYKLTVKHDNSRITYQQDKFGLFDSYLKMTTRTNSMVED